LEHSRIFWFLAGGDEVCYCASADWMQRNLFRRVETCFPITEKRLAQRVMSEGIEPYLADNAQAWQLGADGRYLRSKPGKAARRAAQEVLLERLCESPEPEPRGEGDADSDAARAEVARAIDAKLRRARRKRDGGELGGTPRRAERRGKSIVLEPIVPPEDDAAKRSPDETS
ncbi:MAG: hypothetical protein ACKO4Q_17600, partial [Planctomycetota bacterium]